MTEQRFLLDLDFILNELIQQVSGKPANLCNQVKTLLQTRARTKKAKRASRKERDFIRQEVQDSSDEAHSETDADGWPCDSSESSESDDQFNEYTDQTNNDKTGRGDDGDNDGSLTTH